MCLNPEQKIITIITLWFDSTILVAVKLNKTYLYIGRNCKNSKRPLKKSHFESSFVSILYFWFLTDEMVSGAGL